MALYIFSDAHLGAGAPDEESGKLARIRELFEKVHADGDRLVILGDLFDFWFEYRYLIPKQHNEVLFLLRKMVESGIPVDYVSGNHDFWMGDFFTSQLGITVHRDELELTAHGKKLYLLHGDGLAKADRGYRFLKKILRNRFNIRLYRLLPPDWAYPLARKVSGTSRHYTSARDHTFAPDYEAFAERKLSEGYDVVAIGHLHIPVRKEFGDGVYINTGDFINHFTYARIDGGEVALNSLVEDQG